jgi:glutamate-ammonia-ligase adenylyltransferase
METKHLPQSMQDEMQRHWEVFEQWMANHGQTVARTEEIERVFACSPFVAKFSAQAPERFQQLLSSGDLGRSYDDGEYRARLQSMLSELADEAEFMRTLRQTRNYEMVRIAWRDIMGLADLHETMRDLSNLADAAMDASLAWLYRGESEGLGVAADPSGTPQQLVVIAMGKLGAHELNFSSDIDLIFAYPHEGETSGGKRSLSNQEFFTRLGQKLIRVLGEVTADGFVFRVDMRLRPFGESGPLVLSFDAMELYFTTHARDWERYAMIKARCAAGDLQAGERLLKLLRPFVYRRYIDFGAFQALREMKALINAEVKRKGITGNIKLGPGGIREIEFIGQTFQLIRGGRCPALQTRPILEVLGHLDDLGYLPSQTVAELSNAYRFLRDTEHRLQEVNDQQTQTLPKHPTEQERLAFAMGFPDWETFSEALETHRRRVQRCFTQLLERTEESPAAATDQAKPDLGELWRQINNQELAVSTLARLGYEDPEAIWAILNKLPEQGRLRRMSQRAQERFARLMPMLIGAVAKSPRQQTTLEHLVKLLEAIAHRSVYLALLAEHPEALAQLTRLCSASPWISGLLTRQPILLDELLDPRVLYAPPTPGGLRSQLEHQLAQIPEGDLEQEMNVLRHFKHTQVLRVAAADVAGVLPVSEVSDHLTAIAETALDATLRLATRHLARKHGAPICIDAGARRVAGFAIITYGKLGGIELGYGSDLDIIFLHNSRGEDQVTNGPYPVDNNVFFTRLGQRIIHLLTTITPAGRVYDIDTRLRPSGASGLLVSSVDAYRDYQQRLAWTWEHQALVRARPVVGAREVMEDFLAIRRATLQRQRDEPTLRREIREMRERMRQELSRKDPGMFDLKQAPGGITDIEFMVQYGVLRWAAACPGLLTETSNWHLLEAFAAHGLLAKEDCDALREAYFAYRAKTHALALQECPALANQEEFQKHCGKITAIWRRLMNDGETQA